MIPVVDYEYQMPLDQSEIDTAVAQQQVTGAGLARAWAVEPPQAHRTTAPEILSTGLQFKIGTSWVPAAPAATMAGYQMASPWLLARSACNMSVIPVPGEPGGPIRRYTTSWA